MSAPTTTRTPIESSDDGLTLLLDLFALESPTEAPRRRPAGRHRAGPRAQLHGWIRRPYRACRHFLLRRFLTASA